MPCARFIQKRYQLSKEGVRVLERGHPWIFRSHLSSASDIFPNGQWLKLVGHENEILGYGIYEREGLIAIRILKRGKNPPSISWRKQFIVNRLEKRRELRNYTDAFRAIHGDNDGLSGVVFDVYANAGVLQTYAPSVDSLGRWAASFLRRQLALTHVLWKLPVKRKSENQSASTRVLFGSSPGTIRIREGQLHLAVDLQHGQKSGAFLDLRGLRKWVASRKLNGARVLNLFSYTGHLGIAAEVAGAKEIWNVDVSKGALEFARRYHCHKGNHHRFIEADIFKWIETLRVREKFDCIIVDPPQMASQVVQVPHALKAYRHLYEACLKHLSRNGMIVACCCTSRITRGKFTAEISNILSPRLRLRTSFGPEDDHPVGFPEGDYLKILVFA